MMLEQYPETSEEASEALSEERRTMARVHPKTRIKAWCVAESLKGRPAFSAEYSVVDLSFGGLLLRGIPRLEVGEPLAVGLYTVPLGRLINATAVVVRVMADELKTRVAVRFDDRGEAGGQQLLDWIADEIIRTFEPNARASAGGLG